MVFSSNIFLFVFLPVFMVVYKLLPQKVKNIWILTASLVFYAWGEPSFALLVMALLGFDFYLVKAMHQSEKSRRRRFFMMVSVLMKLALLAYFKYSNFFIDNVDALLIELGVDPIRMTRIILPVGLSFFIFQSITYTVDIYRRLNDPLTRIWDYFLYILLFPQLIAGPIVRYTEIANQLRDRAAEDNMKNTLLGFYRFLIGLSKKVLIANVLGAEADYFFNEGVGDMGTLATWYAVLCYTMQIYFDFSGYSDMAIGLGRMMGFRFPENFDNPYCSRSITEFWRRWHITLGRFMRDYLYIPLGGSRVSSKSRLYFNLWIVFLLSGLWHGAGWTFIIWGAYHGIFLILDRLFLVKLNQRLGTVFSVLSTFLFAMVGWVFFRANDLTSALQIIKTMFSTDWQWSRFFVATDVKWTLGLALLFSFSYLIPGVQELQRRLFNPRSYKWSIHVALWPLIVLMLFVNAAYITSSGFNPFIYFRF